MDLECIDGCADRHAVCRVTGEIDIGTAEEFRREALDALHEHGPSLTLDLSRVTFMDCAGVTVLIFVRAEAERRAGHVALTGVPIQVSRLLRLVGLDTLLGPPTVPPRLADLPLPA